MIRTLSLSAVTALVFGCGGETKPAPASNQPTETPAPAPAPKPAAPKSAVDSSKYQVIAVTEKGTLKGAVTWSGEVPALSAFAIDKDADTCGKEAKNPRLVVDAASKGVANAVISLENITKGADLSPKEGTIDQKTCVYEPHIQILPRGSKMNYLNSDPILHNVHGFLEDESAFNYAMPTQGMKLSKELKKPGIISLKCDAGHTWMSAYLVVVEHPYYALTDAQGNFEIKDIPPGKYQVKMWHEGWDATIQDGAISYGEPREERREVEITNGGTAELRFELAK